MDRSRLRSTIQHPVGRIATLMLVPSAVAVPLGPAWAVLCGVVAAGRWEWRGSQILAVIVTLFVCEVLWSSWRAQLVDMDWPRYLDAHPLPDRGDGIRMPAYTTPWSPIGRIIRWTRRLRRWVRDTLPPERRGALVTVVAAPPLTLLLAALVGWRTLALSLAALSLVLIEWLIARRARPSTALRAALEIGLGWLAGHVAVGPLTFHSLCLACCYALAYQGLLVPHSERTATHAHRYPASLHAFAGQAGSALFTVFHAQPGAPLAAGALGFLLAPQLLLLAHGGAQERAATYARRAAPFVMLAMLIAAWAA